MKAGTLLSIACLCAGLESAGAESHHVVKVSDRADVTTYVVMTEDALRALQAEIQDELKLYPKALDMAQAAWAKDPNNTKSFPNTAVHKRKADTVGPLYADLSEADEKRARLLEKLWAKTKADAKEEKKELNKQVKRYDKARRREIKAELKAKAAVKKVTEARARSVYEAQLAILRPVQAPAGPAPEPAPAPAPW